MCFSQHAVIVCERQFHASAFEIIESCLKLFGPFLTITFQQESGTSQHHSHRRRKKVEFVFSTDGNHGIAAFSSSGSHAAFLLDAPQVVSCECRAERVFQFKPQGHSAFSNCECMIRVPGNPRPQRPMSLDRAATVLRGERCMKSTAIFVVEGDSPVSEFRQRFEFCTPQSRTYLREAGFHAIPVIISRQAQIPQET